MTNSNMTGYPSIDRPWLKYYSEEAINAEVPECTVYQNVLEHNEEHKSEIALEYYGFKITYGKMLEHTEECAKALLQAGVKRGERITICAAGTPEIFYLVLAISKIGAVANFINPLFETQQKIDRINDTEARFLIVLDKMYPYIAEALDKTCIKQVIAVPATYSLPPIVRALASLKDKNSSGTDPALKTFKHTEWKRFIREGKEYTEATEAPYQKNRPVVIVYSSGTTGASKGIMLTNDGINATIRQYETGFKEITRGNRILHIIPIWFSSGVSISLLMPLCLGVTCILEPIFSPETFTGHNKV